jgi:hypothetical protein
MREGVRWWALFLVATALGGCSGGTANGVADECPALPYFDRLPVDESAIASTTVIGGFSPPAHTLPSDHGGIYLAARGVPLVAPGPLTVTSIRRTRYLASAFRAGSEDHALDLAVCGSVRLSIGHVVSLSSELAALIQPGGCQRYDTANESVEACYTRVDRRVEAGAPLGTVGGDTAGAFDFGVYDRRHRNTFANQGRVGDQMRQALCPWEPFADGPRAALLARVGRGTDRRIGEPACGTMEVDRPGTAAGIWIEQSRAAAPFGGDESPYVTLTRDVVRPAETLLFAIGLPALGPGTYLAAVSHEGQRQRAFDEVLPGGAVTCYEVRPGVFRPAGSPRVSFLLALDQDRLRLEKREDAGACDGDPSSWVLGPAAVTFVR